MSSKLFWRLLALCITVAFCISGLSILFLNRYTQGNVSRHRDDFVLLWSDSIGKQLSHLTIDQIKTQNAELRYKLRPPMIIKGFGPGMPPPEGPGRPPGPPPFEMRDGRPFAPPQPPDVWIISESGSLLVSSKNSKLEKSWKNYKKPTELNELKINEDFFRLFSPTFIVKISVRDAFVYLVIKDNMKPFLGYLLLTQALLSFGTLVISLGLALLLTFFYLRKKSLQAREVLLRLEQGDLKARFPIKRFDEFGSLLLDFNRMAEEIEKLVNRLYLVESTRKNLLQELGHDVRTPLTTIKTSVETLKAFSDKMNSTQKSSMFEMLEDEITYMHELFEKLMTIATLDEPHYKKTTEKINLHALLSEELESRKSSNPKIKWHLEASSTENFLTTGDSHLLLRLFKNALDNASRFAKETIQIKILRSHHFIEVHILDDGPGFSAEALKNYGLRREFSGRQTQKNSPHHHSLGLGSVIIKAIIELHGGNLSIQNAVASTGLSGAHLILRLPTIPQS